MFFTRSNRRVFPLISLATKALHSTHIVGDKPVLVRDSIHSALYHFSQKSRSIGVLPNTIRFNQLQGRKAYMKYLDNIYKQSDISWFTPVEIFKPWYAHAIAEAIMRTANFSVPLKEEARGMDGSHWLVVCEPPFEIKFVEFYADYYAKLLEPYVGSEKEAKKIIYSISKEIYFGFGAVLTEETVQNLRGTPVKDGKLDFEALVKMETDLDDYDIGQQMKQLKEAELAACKGSGDALKFHATRWGDID